MNRIDISVIVPVYKVKYELLKKCLNSFINQDYKFVEFLIIDDGSPDECGKICDEFAQKDIRIKVFHRLNEGVSGARNFGLSKAQGKYIIFVDGDDYILQGAIEKLITTSLKFDYDIAFFRYNRIKEGDPEPINVEIHDEKKLYAEQIASAIVSNNEKKIGMKDVCLGSPWGKIFKKEYILNNNIIFPMGIKKSQDRIFMLRTLAFSPKIGFINNYVYCYVENDASICQAYNPNIIQILNNAADEFERTIHKYFRGNIKEQLLKDFNYLQFDFLFNMFRLFFFNRKNEESNEQYKKYLELCIEKRKYYINCSCVGMGKKKKIILIMLKCRMFRFLYILMKKLN